MRPGSNLSRIFSLFPMYELKFLRGIMKIKSGLKWIFPVLIGIANYPGFYTFPYTITLPVMVLQAGVFLVFLYFLRRERDFALAILGLDLFTLFVSAKVLYFHRPFILSSELLLRKHPTFYFYWYFLLASLVLAGLIYISKRAEKPLLWLALALVFTMAYNLKFLEGKERFVVRDHAVYMDGFKITDLRERPDLKILYHHGRATVKKDRLVVREERKEIYSLSSFTILKTPNLSLEKKGIFLKFGREKFPILFPWYLLEVLLLPLALLFLFIIKHLIPWRFSPILLIFLLTLIFLLQGVYFWRAAPKGFLYFDTWEYLLRAESILRGFGFGEEILIGGNGPCYWSPLPFFYNAAFVYIFSRNWDVYLLFRGIMFLIFLLFIYKISIKYRVPPAVYLILFGLSGYVIYYAGIESEAIFLLFLLPSFYLLVSQKKPLLSGILMGLSLLARPAGLLLALFWLFPLRKKVLSFIFGLSLVLFPWALHCTLRTRKLVLITSGGVPTFFSGNSPFSTGGWAPRPTMMLKFRKMGYEPTSLKDILRYNLTHPSNILRLFPMKLLWAFWKEPKNRQWHPPAVPGHKLYGISPLRFKFYTPFSEVFKFFLYIFAMIGAVALFREREYFSLLALLWFLTTTLVFLGLPRYTASFAPFLYLFAAKGVKKCFT